MFERLSAMYGSKFATMWAGVNPQSIKAVWAEELGELSGEEIADGLRACMDRDWPPTLPEFMRLCNPKPDYETLFRQSAAGGPYPSKVAFWAAQNFGPFELRTATWERAKVRWTKCVDDAWAQRHTLADPPPARIALPAPGQTYTPEKAHAAVAKMREILGAEKGEDDDEDVPQ